MASCLVAGQNITDSIVGRLKITVATHQRQVKGGEQYHSSQIWWTLQRKEPCPYSLENTAHTLGISAQLFRTRFATRTPQMQGIVAGDRHIGDGFNTRK